MGTILGSEISAAAMPNRPPQLLADFLRRQTQAWLVPLALAGIALASSLLYGVHQRQLTEIKVVAQRIGDEIAADLLLRQHGLRVVIAAATVDGPNPPMQTWYRHAKAYDQTFDTTVLLVDAQRHVVFNTRRPLGQLLDMLPNPPGRSGFNDAFASGEFQVGDVVWGPVLKAPVVSVIVPAGSQYGLLGLIPLNEVKQSLLRQRLPEGWVSTVFDSVGNTIASTADEPQLHTANYLAQRGYVAIIGTPWSVAVDVDAWSFFRPHFQVALASLICVCLAFAGTAIATKRSSLSLLSAVERLTDKLPIGRPHDQATKATKSLPARRIFEFEAARSELKRLSAARYQAEEAERSRIARDLHDGIQQDIAAIHINLNVALSRLEEQTHAREAMNAAQYNIKRVLKALQSAVNDLRPASLDDGGLMVALEELTQQFTALTGTQVELEVVSGDNYVDDIPRPIAYCLYRITQECLNNVRKHAQASFVHIELDVLGGMEVRLRVADDGVGLGSPPQIKHTGFGTQSMVERANALNGSLAVWHGPQHNGDDANQGTTVLVTLPLPSQA